MEQIGLLLLASLIIGVSKGGQASAGALAVPILSVWMDPLVAAGLLLPIFIVSDVVGVWLYRREYSAKNVLLLIPAGLVGVILASFLTPFISSTIAALVTGLIGLFYCAQRPRPVAARGFQPSMTFLLARGFAKSETDAIAPDGYERLFFCAGKMTSSVLSCVDGPGFARIDLS